MAGRAAWGRGAGPRFRPAGAPGGALLALPSERGARGSAPGRADFGASERVGAGEAGRPRTSPPSPAGGRAGVGVGGCVGGRRGGGDDLIVPPAEGGCPSIPGPQRCAPACPPVGLLSGPLVRGGRALGAQSAKTGDPGPGSGSHLGRRAWCPAVPRAHGVAERTDPRLGGWKTRELCSESRRRAQQWSPDLGSCPLRPRRTFSRLTLKATI